MKLNETEISIFSKVYVRRTRAAAVLITILVGIRDETDSYLYSVTDTLSVSRGFLQYMQKDAAGVT
jgi:hypothetical protein